MADEPADFVPFTFIDQSNPPRAYRVELWNGQPWLFYWREHEKKWVSYRPLYPDDEAKLRPRALPAEEAALYDKAEKGRK